jgi:hypothetical protein
MTQTELISAQTKKPGREQPLITAELIDYHRRRAHQMRNAVIHQAMGYALRSLRNMLRQVQY